MQMLTISGGVGRGGSQHQVLYGASMGHASSSHPSEAFQVARAKWRRLFHFALAMQNGSEGEGKGPFAWRIEELCQNQSRGDTPLATQLTYQLCENAVEVLADWKMKPYTAQYLDFYFFKKQMPLPFQLHKYPMRLT